MNISKKLREALGESLSGCAKQMGTAISTLKLYENGGTVTDKTKEKIAGYFNVTVEQLEGREPLNIELWAMRQKLSKQEQKLEPAPIVAPKITPIDLSRPPALCNMGIVQVIKTSHAAVNFYLEEGWILLDTAPMKDDDNGFFCLIGNTDVWSQEDFERVKRKNKASQKSYWMTK